MDYLKNKIEISWDHIFTSLNEIDKDINIVYGVPNGGMIMTAFLHKAQVTHKPGYANLIIDDIWDSGKTANHYLSNYPEAMFMAIIDKRKPEYKGKWIVMPWEKDHPGKKNESIQDNIVRQLQYIGEDPEREGLKETPDRIVRMYDEIFVGYSKDPADILTTFSTDGYDQIILLKDIEMYSMCEHHIVPFFGKANVAYIPDKKVIGISKLARLLDIYAHRLQIQERIGMQVTDALMKYLQPKGAACIIEASHLCMRMRGVEKQHSTMTTSSMKGVFMEKQEAREELMQLIKS